MYIRHLSMLTFVLVFSGLAGQAQKKSFAVEVTGGLNISNPQEETNLIIGTKQSKTGFQLGVNADYGLTNSVYIRSGLSFTTKGTTHRDTDIWIGGTNPPITYRTTKTTQNYLQLPLAIGYRYRLTSKIKLFANAGPYIAYGIGGNEVTRKKTVFPSGEIRHEKDKSAPFGAYNNMKLLKMDYGISGGLGASYKRISCAVNYEYGLKNIGDLNEESSFFYWNYYNRNLSVTVGYTL